MRYRNERLSEIVDLCHGLQGELGLNAFSLLSAGTLQLENFHSRILAELLNPLQRHGRSELLMRGLFELLAAKADAHGKKKLAAGIRRTWDEGFYQGVRVETEYPVFSEGHCGRIDIMLRNDLQKRVVIVENKINGAPDMSRQLLRYIKALEPYEIVAVVYLKPFDGDGHPDWRTWSEAEREIVNRVLVPISACVRNDSHSLQSWMKDACGADESMRDFAVQYIGFVSGQVADQERWDKLCQLVAGIGPSILMGVLSDKTAARIIEMLPEYIERRVLYACPPCEFQKNIYSDRFECATFQRYFVGEAQYGEDAPELGLDVTDEEIRFFVREDRKRLVTRDNFKRLSVFLQRVDEGFAEAPRGRLNQYVIKADNAYDNVSEYVCRVAKIVASLSDAKAAITKSLVG